MVVETPTRHHSKSLTARSCGLFLSNIRVMEKIIKEQESIETKWSQSDKIEDYPINSPRWLSLIDFVGEQWKEIKGYDGKYLISCYGRVKNTGSSFSPPHILKVYSPKIRSSYWRVDLYYNRQRITRVLHRYVAEAFIPNPDNLPFVNHKDENKLNPCVSNLEWCTQKYNSNYGTFPERMRHMKLKRGLKTVYQYTIDGQYVASYPSSKQASAAMGLKSNNISEVCNAKYKRNTAKGFIWSYTTDEAEIRKRVNMVNNSRNRFGGRNKRKKIKQYTLNGELVNIFPSACSAAYANNIHRWYILECAKGNKKTYKGYKWTFA